MNIIIPQEGETVRITLPAWLERLQAGGPLPPEPPSGGWGRWWDDHQDLVWLAIIVGAVGLAYHLVGELTTLKLREQG